MLAAWLPGRRAAKIPPVAAMSSVHAQATTQSLVLRNTVGALFAAAGVARRRSPPRRWTARTARPRWGSARYC